MYGLVGKRIYEMYVISKTTIFEQPPSLELMTK